MRQVTYQDNIQDKIQPIQCKDCGSKIYWSPMFDRWKHFYELPHYTFQDVIDLDDDHQACPTGYISTQLID